MNAAATKNPWHESDYGYATGITKWMYLPFGLWPLNISPKYSFIRPFSIAWTLVAVMFLTIPMCCFAYEYGSHVKLMMKLLGPLSFSFINLFKVAVIIRRRNDLADLLQHIAEDWRKVEKAEDRRVMLKFARYGRILSIVCILLLYGAGFLYFVIVPTTRPAVRVGNLTLYYLPYPSHFYFFNPRVKPIYNVILTFQCISSTMRYTINCSVFSIVIIFVMHISGQIAVTSSMFDQLIANFNYRKLGQVVRSHINFLKFAKKIEDIFSEVFLAEVFGSTFNICLVGYHIITEFEENKEPIQFVMYFVYFLSFTFNIFILCYIGQILNHYCDDIGNTSYNTRWYELPAKDAWHMLFLISCKQRPVNLTAGKLLNLSLGTFIKIMKTAAGSLNMLRNIVAHTKASADTVG